MSPRTPPDRLRFFKAETIFEKHSGYEKTSDFHPEVAETMVSERRHSSQELSTLGSKDSFHADIPHLMRINLIIDKHRKVI